MPICNMSKTIHNILLQKYGKRGACLSIATLDDYVQAFKQLTFYYAFLHGGRSRISSNRDELQLRKASQFSDPLQMAIVVAKLALDYSYTSKILHLEGEEIFGFVKWKQNLPLGLEGDSHRHDRAIFSYMWVEFSSCNFVPNGDVGQSSGSQEGFPFLIHNGEEVLKCLYGDNVWHIEWCNPKSNAQCSALLKDTKHYCKAKIISRGMEWGIPAPHYVGNLNVSKDAGIELHKFWFCHDDQSRCVEGFGRKYAIGRPIVPSLWHV